MTLFLAACGGKASSSSSQPLPVPPEVFSSSEAMMRETVQLHPYSFDLPGPEEDPEADPLVGAVMAGLLICGVVLLLIRLLCTTMEVAGTFIRIVYFLEIRIDVQAVLRHPQADIIISGRPEAARMTMAMLRQAKCGRAITEVELNPFPDDEIIYILSLIHI